MSRRGSGKIPTRQRTFRLTRLDERKPRNDQRLAQTASPFKVEDLASSWAGRLAWRRFDTNRKRTRHTLSGPHSLRTHTRLAPRRPRMFAVVSPTAAAGAPSLAPRVRVPRGRRVSGSSAMTSAVPDPLGFGPLGEQSQIPRRRPRTRIPRSTPRLPRAAFATDDDAPPSTRAGASASSSSASPRAAGGTPSCRASRGRAAARLRA